MIVGHLLGCIVVLGYLSFSCPGEVVQKKGVITWEVHGCLFLCFKCMFVSVYQLKLLVKWSWLAKRFEND